MAAVPRQPLLSASAQFSLPHSPVLKKDISLQPGLQRVFPLWRTPVWFHRQVQFMKQFPDTQAVEICCLWDAWCPQTSNGGKHATSPLTACALPRQVLSSAFNTAIIQSLPGSFSRSVISDFFPPVVVFSSSCLLPKLLMLVYKPMENKGSGDTEVEEGLWPRGTPRSL